MFATTPPTIEPSGAPIANDETASDHSSVVWPGKTTASGAFITLVLYPLRNCATIATSTAISSGAVTTSSESSASMSSFDSRSEPSYATDLS